MKEPMKIVHAFIDPIVKDAVAKKQMAKTNGANPEYSGQEGRDGETLLENLVNSTEGSRRKVLSLL